MCRCREAHHAAPTVWERKQATECWTSLLGGAAVHHIYLTGLRSDAQTVKLATAACHTYTWKLQYFHVTFDSVCNVVWQHNQMSDLYVCVNIWHIHHYCRPLLSARYICICSKTSLTSPGGRMCRTPTFRSGRSGNPKITSLSLEPVGLKPGRANSMTLKLILVAS